MSFVFSLRNRLIEPNSKKADGSWIIATDLSRGTSGQSDERKAGPVAKGISSGVTKQPK
jgi:hypothetical protein